MLHPRLALALALCLCVLSSPAVQGTSSVRYGVLGNDDRHAADEIRRGLTVRIVTVRWRRAEPSPGAFDRAYLGAIRNRAAALRTKGFKLVLNTGLHHAPAWLMAMPNSRYRSQSGLLYRSPADDLPNLVFNTKLRAYASRYLRQLFASLGANWYAIRVGGGPLGELQYPDDRFAGKRNQYWAFDGAAALTNPVPGWKPGMPSANHAKARAFLDWYLGRLAQFQNWQIAEVRRWSSSPIAVLYPGWGIRAGQAAAAIQHDLDGSTSAEINGEIQEGKAFARQLNVISATGIVAWTTYAERRGDEASADSRRWGPTHYLAYLAGRRGFRIMGENSGRDDALAMGRALRNARQYGMAAFLWAREEELYCHCGGYATIEDYDARIP